VDRKVSLAMCLAFVWGAVWAAVLQWTWLGRFLAMKRTWITTVVGVGVDLVIVLLCVPFDMWMRFAGVIAFSSICIIVRSLVNEQREIVDLGRELRGDENEIGE